MTTATEIDAAKAAIIAAEQKRCAAIRDRDHDSLSSVVTDDLHYLHSTGLLDDKDAYIAMSITKTPRRIERGELDVRVFGDVAVVIGDYGVRVEPDEEAPQGRSVDASGLQVWLRQDGQWRLWAHQGTAKP